MRFLAHREYASGVKWCVWRWKDIYPCDDGKLYLTRLHLLQTPWFVVMLHWILMADPQPDPHNHPVNFLSVLLRGSYDELRGESQMLRSVRLFNLIHAGNFHRIVKTHGKVLTLCFGSSRCGEWGFKTAAGWVPWRRYEGGCE